MAKKSRIGLETSKFFSEPKIWLLTFFELQMPCQPNFDQNRWLITKVKKLHGITQMIQHGGYDYSLFQIREIINYDDCMKHTRSINFFFLQSKKLQHGIYQQEKWSIDQSE